MQDKPIGAPFGEFYADMTPLFGDGPYFNLQHNLVHAVRGGDELHVLPDGQRVEQLGVVRDVREFPLGRDGVGRQVWSAQEGYPGDPA